MPVISLPNGKRANLTINSLLLARDEIRPETLDSIRNACASGAVAKAAQLFGEGQALTVRDLNATDMSYTNNVFTETSNATTNAWNAMAFGAFTIATGTVIGIYGLKLSCILDATIKFLPISAVRLEVGGARVAQWIVQQLDQASNNATASPMRGYMGVTKSPIIVGEDMSVTIYEYTRTASTVYTPVWLGVTVEKEGRTLKP